MIELRGVSKTVSSGGQPLTILHPLTMSVPAGQCLAIIGPSGSGKSTLLGLIAGLDSPSSGNILIDGVDITALDEDRLAAVARREDRLRLPVLSSGAVADRAREHPGADGDRGPPRRQTKGPGAPRRGRAARPRASLSVAALGRRAAAHRHRPGAGQRSAAHPGGRADRQPRFEQRTAHPRSADVGPQGAKRDARDRHARPVGGGDCRRATGAARRPLGRRSRCRHRQEAPR